MAKNVGDVFETGATPVHARGCRMPQRMRASPAMAAFDFGVCPARRAANNVAAHWRTSGNREADEQRAACRREPTTLEIIDDGSADAFWQRQQAAPT